MKLTNEERRLLITAVQDLDANGRYGQRASLLLDKLQKCEQESKNEQTSLREQILRLEKALDNAIKQCCINVSGSDACASLDELYEAFEKKVWEGVKVNDSTRDV